MDTSDSQRMAPTRWSTLRRAVPAGIIDTIKQEGLGCRPGSASSIIVSLAENGPSVSFSPTEQVDWGHGNTVLPCAFVNNTLICVWSFIRYYR